MNLKSALSTSMILTAVLSTLVSSAPRANADLPGAHPNYVQAMTDLRTAKSYLARPDAAEAQKDEINAVQEIDACLHDLLQAAVVDGQNVATKPLPDAGERGNRIMRSLELLGKAQLAIESKEDDAAVLQARASALKHIAIAITYAKKAYGDDAMQK